MFLSTFNFYNCLINYIIKAHIFINVIVQTLRKTFMKQLRCKAVLRLPRVIRTFRGRNGPGASRARHVHDTTSEERNAPRPETNNAFLNFRGYTKIPRFVNITVRSSNIQRWSLTSTYSYRIITKTALKYRKSILARNS